MTGMKKEMLLVRVMTLSILFVLGLNSCVSVKPYQKMHLNDSDMELSTRKAEKFEQTFLLYREGSSGANGGKSGGGCGCN
ncbi:MAG TPA: DUF4266 domain-containing protein [Chitinophagales bacterium]|nr:DUF4266 domain-containing protein [Chitinophagales bacterium]